jgi:hypothetical protein
VFARSDYRIDPRLDRVTRWERVLPECSTRELIAAGVSVSKCFPMNQRELGRTALLARLWRVDPGGRREFALIVQSFYLPGEFTEFYFRKLS